jgi:S-DNA-T family DNA segregation ATPase FtsK/SpoIIIE
LPKEQQQKYEQQMRIQAQRAALSQPRPSTFGQTFFSPYQQYQFQQPAYMPLPMSYGAPFQYQNPYAPMMPQPYVQQPFAPQMMMAPSMMAQPMMAQPMMGGYNPNPFNYQAPSYNPYGGGYSPYPSYGGYRY